MSRYLYILLAAAILSCSEVDDQLQDEAEGGLPAAGYGSVTFALGMEGEVASRVEATASIYEIPEELIPSVEDDFTLTLSGRYIDLESGEEMSFEESYESVDEFNAEAPYLPAGVYTAAVSSGGDLSQESSTNACFGASESFTLEARDEVQIEITACLLNSIVRLTASDEFNGYFGGGASLTLSTEAGSELYYAIPDNSANEGAILFLAPETDLYLEGEGYKQNPTESSTATVSKFSKSLIGATSAGEMTTVTVTAEQAGASALVITLDDSTTTIYDETFELNE